MGNNAEPDFSNQLQAVFGQLKAAEVEEFYAAYRQWIAQQRVSELRQRLEAVRIQQAENQQRIAQTRPSPIALAALARLQSNGVNDIELLDTMLERGEEWLDQTMQRLDYFEQFDDFISDDYTKWCQGAVEGAFDWIDSVREAGEQDESLPLATSTEEAPLNGAEAEEVETLLLQRLAIDDKEDELSWQEAITLKRPAIQVFSEETDTNTATEQQVEALHEETTLPETAVQAAEYIPQDESLADNESAINTTADDFGGLEEQIIPEEVPFIEDMAPQDVYLSDEGRAGGEDQTGEEQAELFEGDRKGPLPAPPGPRFYYDAGSESPGAFIVQAGVDEEGGGDPRGRLRVPNVPVEEVEEVEDTLISVTEQPTLVEFAAVEEPGLAEAEPDIQEQPTLIEIETPPEVSQAEDETIDQIAEQSTTPEIAIPEDISIAEDTPQNEISEPARAETVTPEEVNAPVEHPAIKTGEPVTQARSEPRKRGFLGTLIWILTGK